MTVRCDDCRLRRLPMFRPAAAEEVAFIQALRLPQVVLPPRAHILQPDAPSEVFYTLHAGWAFRYRALAAGERQIVDFLLPGALIGLYASLEGHARHGVCAVTEVVLCPLRADRFAAVFAEQPNLSRGLVHDLLLEEQRFERRLLLLGHQRATQRLSFLMLELRDRLLARGLGEPGVCDFPLTYEQLTDALGLSRSQLARSLSELRDRGWAMLANGRVSFFAPEQMAAFCGYDSPVEWPLRSLI